MGRRIMGRNIITSTVALFPEPKLFHVARVQIKGSLFGGIRRYQEVWILGEIATF
jgi:hypothetical protein